MPFVYGNLKKGIKYNMNKEQKSVYVTYIYPIQFVR